MAFRSALKIGAFVSLAAFCEIAVAQAAHATGRTSSNDRVIPTTAELVRQIRQALVMITTKDHDGSPVAQGSGFFISPKLVVTNLHVLKRAFSGSLKSAADGVTYKIGEVRAFSLKEDICVLYVPNANGEPLPSATDKPEVGQDILVAGNPEGLEGTFSKGIVSAIRPEAGLIQIDAPISPGSSGGPVVNKHGAVVGVAVSSLVEGQNLNFAVPIRYAGGHLTGRIAEGTTSIDTIGRLAVTDRENLGFQGPVRTIEETEASYSYDSTADRYTLGPGTPSGSRIKFDPDGRIQEENSFFGGRCAGSLTYEYQEDGLEIQQTYIDCDGKHEVSDLSLSDGVDAMASRIHLCETEEMGPATEKYRSVRKYDCSGREVEFSTPGTSHTTVTKYDPQGRDIEELEYKNGALITATRSEYKTNAHGDWVERHETQWNSKFPSLGFTPLLEEHRDITYYEGHQ